MLPQSYRIPRRSFPHPQTKMRTWLGTVLKIRSYKGEESTFHTAIITSKKTYTTKPERNLFKRRVCAALQKHLHKSTHVPCDYVLVFPLIHTKDISFSQIEKDIANYFSSSFTKKV